MSLEQTFSSEPPKSPELTLAAILRERLGAHVEELVVPGNRPVVLGDVSCVWITLSGRLELFSMRVRDDALYGARTHFASCESGQLVLARDYARRGEDSVLVGVGDQNTRVLCVPARALVELIDHPQLSPLVVTLYDRWVTTLAQASGFARRPRGFQNVRFGETVHIDERTVLGCGEGVGWVATNSTEIAMYGGRSDARKPPGWVPLTSHSWLEVSHGDVTAHGTIDLLRFDPAGQRFLVDFYEYALALSLANQSSSQARQRVKDYRALESDVSQLSTALGSLARVGAGDADRNLLYKEPVLATLEVIAGYLQVPLPEVPERLLHGDATMQIDALSRLMRVRTRKVTLDGSRSTQSAGPLLSHLRVGERVRPVALLPTRKGGYDLFDPADGSTRPLEKVRDLELDPVAYQFYPALPARPLSVWDVMRFGARGQARDAALVAAIGPAAGLLGLVMPLLTGHVYDALIPEAERGLLVQLMLVAGGLTFGSLMFELARRIVLVRVEARFDTSLQPAMWDRLLSLPLPFFRDYNAGDLSARAEGIDQIRRVLASGTLSALLAGIFSLFNLILLFQYDGALAVTATLLAGISAAGAAATTLGSLRYQRRLVEIEGRLEGFLLQILTGIAKLRVSGTESRAFRVWARMFEQKRDAEQRTTRAHNRFRSLHAAYPLLSSAVLFALVMRPEHARLGTGDFLAFSAAFGAMTGALLTLVDSFLSALSIVPLYERARPILEAVPEIDELKSPPGELTGAIEVNQVSFRYEPAGAPVLDDVSLNIEAGRFVGLVGASGSGKSTLLRIMLGLDLPETGGVSFDGRALSGLDTREVRRQIGTVMQSSTLMEGDIFSNIVGSTGLGVEDAKRAAEQAGMTDDIASFPMGIHTLVNQGGGTLSGGQRQRLLIARALVSQPRILFFDEATSALDNRTQEIVSQALERLNVTRIVVAHRLSTIRHADRIFVMERGKLIESGSYDELMALDGAFTRLARRQLL